MGLTGPDKGAGGKYLVLGPGQSVDAADGYTVVTSSMNNIFHAFRVLATDQGEAKKLRESYQAYPNSKRDNPSSTRMVSPDGKHWEGSQPCGLDYWKHEIAGLDSRKDLAKNDDGSVDLYFGPEPPKGHEKNWILTAPGRGWFAYFRLYAPTEAYFDCSWGLPDLVHVT